MLLALSSNEVTVDIEQPDPRGHVLVMTGIGMFGRGQARRFRQLLRCQTPDYPMHIIATGNPAHMRPGSNALREAQQRIERSLRLHTDYWLSPSERFQIELTYIRAAGRQGHAPIGTTGDHLIRANVYTQDFLGKTDDSGSDREDLGPIMSSVVDGFAAGDTIRAGSLEDELRALPRYDADPVLTVVRPIRIGCRDGKNVDGFESRGFNVKLASPT